ncbi:ANM_HP_G0073180.mRNA.1.CDS.1 [Saccharomyces cerevisiae]|nr:ANM_HP_G0108480.mRNA.1.CDS.1 [Saccharomyces cerevisiae]CAI4976008.1 ANM_HP_G0144690.mRNA.1.CDS.1 [Saccharomyces cerevisiae]CAI5144399.1 ANM_HP_G0229640.mRNA.1.CDS.1 [Saccharomyces cerevisiae]CAI5225236.1 ANM_HP_G0071790.mRNA.1.CDS.1 [Saccharomyces cerevisiae]CAI5225375.1 ANM_HP_G0073180.mRNA.1.CDS.1 [Saccharomyces cerevisiae]
MVELLKTSFINKEKMAAFGSFVTEDQEKMEVDENEQSNKLFEKIEGHLEHGVFFYDRDFFFKNVCVKM